MREQFEEALGLESSHDISGMTELYGPGAGIECNAHEGFITGEMSTSLNHRSGHPQACA